VFIGFDRPQHAVDRAQMRAFGDLHLDMRPRIDWMAGFHQLTHLRWNICIAQQRAFVIARHPFDQRVQVAFQPDDSRPLQQELARWRMNERAAARGDDQLGAQVW